MHTTLFAAALLLLACSAWGQDEKTAIKTGFGPPLEERTDHKRGIFVSVTRHKDEDPDTFGSAVSRAEIEETGGVKYPVITVKNDTNTTRIRIRLTADTLGYLITSQTEPVYLRSIATRDLAEAKLDRKTTVDFLTKAARDSEPLLRQMAAARLESVKPREDALPLLVELLKDPDIEVAHRTLFPLIEHYQLKGPDGKPPAVTTNWRGPALAYYRKIQLEVVRVAELLRAAEPALVSQKDLDAICSRNVPDRNWYLRHGWKDAAIPPAQDDYRKTYLSNRGVPVCPAPEGFGK